MSLAIYERTDEQRAFTVFAEGFSIGKRSGELELFNSFDHDDADQQALDESMCEVPVLNAEPTSTTGPAFRIGMEMGRMSVFSRCAAYEALDPYQRVERGQNV